MFPPLVFSASFARAGVQVFLGFIFFQNPLADTQRRYAFLSHVLRVYGVHGHRDPLAGAGPCKIEYYPVSVRVVDRFRCQY